MRPLNVLNSYENRTPSLHDRHFDVHGARQRHPDSPSAAFVLPEKADALVRIGRPSLFRTLKVQPF
jgi:hypothetical protein